MPRSLITSEKKFKQTIQTSNFIKNSDKDNFFALFLTKFSPFRPFDFDSILLYPYTASSNLKPLRNARSVVNVNLIKRTL